jgi:hypothetical protein
MKLVRAGVDDMSLICIQTARSRHAKQLGV